MSQELEYQSPPLEPHEMWLEGLKEKIELMTNCFDQLEVLKEDHENFAENFSYIKAKAVSILETVSATLDNFEAAAERVGCKITDLEYENSELRSMVVYYKEASESLTERVEKLKSYLKDTENENQTLVIQAENMHQEIHTKECQRMEVDNEVMVLIGRLEEENGELRAQIEKYQSREQNHEEFVGNRSRKSSVVAAERLDDGDDDYQLLFETFQDYKAKAEQRQQQLEASLSKLQKQLRTIVEDSIKTLHKSSRVSRKDRFASLPAELRRCVEHRAAPLSPTARKASHATRSRIEKNEDSTNTVESRDLNQLAQGRKNDLTTEEDADSSLNFITPPKSFVFPLSLLNTNNLKELERTGQRKMTASGFRLADLLPALPKEQPNLSVRASRIAEFNSICNLNINQIQSRQMLGQSTSFDPFTEKYTHLNGRSRTFERKENPLNSSDHDAKSSEKLSPIMRRLDLRTPQESSCQSSNISSVSKEIEHDQIIGRLDLRTLQQSSHQSSDTSSISKEIEHDQSLENQNKSLIHASFNANKLGFFSTLLMFTIFFSLKLSCNTFGMFWRAIFHRKS